MTLNRFFEFAVALIAVALVAGESRFKYPRDKLVAGDVALTIGGDGAKSIVKVSLEDDAITTLLTTNPAITDFSLCDDGMAYFGTSLSMLKFDADADDPAADNMFDVGHGVAGLACFTNTTHDLIFMSTGHGQVDSHAVPVEGKPEHLGQDIRAYDRNVQASSTDDFVWMIPVNNAYNLALSPDLRHLAFATRRSSNQVGTINIETKAITLYGSGQSGKVDGTADVAQFTEPNSVDWSADGGTLVVVEFEDPNKLRFIDFETGDVTSSEDNLLPENFGRDVSVKVLDSTHVLVSVEWTHTSPHTGTAMVLQINGIGDTCGNVPTVADSNGGNPTTGVFVVNDTVSYVCDEGHTTDGQVSGPATTETTCQANTTWTSPGSCDIISCSAHNTTDTNAATPSEGLTFGTVANFTCDTGFESFTRQCQANGTWTNSDVVCERVTCGNVPAVANADNGNDTTGFFEDTVTFACDVGFTANGASQTSTCQSDATWSAVACMTYTTVTIDTITFVLSITTGGVTPTGFDNVVNDNLVACVATTATLADASEMKAQFASYTGTPVSLFTDAFQPNANASSAGVTTTLPTNSNFKSMPAGKYTAVCVQQKNSTTGRTDWSATNLNVIAQSASFDITSADSSASTSTVSVVTVASGMVLALVVW